MIHTSQENLRCGIVLAGGEGKRLQSFVHQLRGSPLPKQYVNFVGTRSMLQHTFDRAKRLIPRERLFTIASEDHLKYSEARQQLLARPIHTIVLQPINRETAPGLLLPLMHVYKRYPHSTVAVFPSDHFILEEDLFMAHVELAFRVVEQAPSSVVLIGMRPDQLETEYGYIVPAGSSNGFAALDIRPVESFVEKPDRQTAQALVSRGALWNTMVTVFNVKNFLSLVSAIAPALYQSFQPIYRVIGTAAEALVTEHAYRHIEPLNFSKDVLEVLAAQQRHLAVVPVNGVLWSDWGSAPHIIDTLQTIRRLDARHQLPTNPRWRAELKDTQYSPERFEQLRSARNGVFDQM